MLKVARYRFITTYVFMKFKLKKLFTYSKLAGGKTGDPNVQRAPTREKNRNFRGLIDTSVSITLLR